MMFLVTGSNDCHDFQTRDQKPTAVTDTDNLGLTKNPLSSATIYDWISSFSTRTNRPDVVVSDYSGNMQTIYWRGASRIKADVADVWTGLRAFRTIRMNEW